MPQVHFVLPASLQRLAGGERKVSVTESSLRDAVATLVEQRPELGSYITDDAGNLRPYINLFVDNQQVLDLDAAPPKLRDGSELLLVSAVAGG